MRNLEEIGSPVDFELVVKKKKKTYFFVVCFQVRFCV